MSSAEYNLIFRAPMPSPSRCGRCCSGVVSIVFAIRFTRWRFRCMLPVSYASSTFASTPTPTAAPSRILRIAGIVVTVTTRRHRLARGRAQFVRPFLPTLTVIVASVGTRAGCRTRLVKLALPLLVSRPPDYPTLGTTALAAG